MGVAFPRYYNKNDFGMGTTASGINLVTTDFTTIGSYQVGYRQQVALGSGKVTDGGRDDRRTATIKLYTSAGQLTDGRARVCYADANLLNIVPVQDDLLSNWSAGVLLEEKSLRAQEQSYLKVQAMSTSSTTLDFTNASTQCDIPAVLYAL